MRESPRSIPAPGAATDTSIAQAWRAELRRGLVALRAGAFDDAVHRFERAHRLAPESPEVCYALGRERLRAGHLDEARSLLERAWRGDATLLSAACVLARCLAQDLDRPDDAAALLDEAAAVHGDDPALLVVRAELHLTCERWDEARATAEAALAAAPRPAEEAGARAALARVENQAGIDAAGAGDCHRALFSFKRAADLDPGWSSPHVNAGAVFARLGNHDRARDAYARAVSIDPDNPMAHFNLGLLCRDVGDVGGAAAALERAVDLAPDQPDFWTQLGITFADTGDRDSAEACLRQAIDLEPDHREACLCLADLLARDARYLEAAVLARRAERLE